MDILKIIYKYAEIRARKMINRLCMLFEDYNDHNFKVCHIDCSDLNIGNYIMFKYKKHDGSLPYDTWIIYYIEYITCSKNEILISRHTCYPDSKNEVRDRTIIYHQNTKIFVEELYDIIDKNLKSIA